MVDAELVHCHPVLLLGSQTNFRCITATYRIQRNVKGVIKYAIFFCNELINQNEYIDAHVFVRIYAFTHKIELYVEMNSVQFNIAQTFKLHGSLLKYLSLSQMLQTVNS